MTTLQRDRPSTKDDLSLPRLYLLRAGYLIVGGGLAVTKWPEFVNHEPWPLMDGVVNCMLAAMSLLALLGLRYPLRMLPVLMFETAWKLIWLAAVALPLWTDSRLDAATAEVAFECAFIVIVMALVPWDYVYRQYVTRPGDRWRS